VGRGAVHLLRILAANACCHEDLRNLWLIWKWFTCRGKRFSNRFFRFAVGPARGVGDLRRVKEFGGLVAVERTAKHSVSRAGNEIPDVAASGERRHGQLICPPRPMLDPSVVGVEDRGSFWHRAQGRCGLSSPTMLEDAENQLHNHPMSIEWVFNETPLPL
jgi:hypothetical protein